MILGKYIATGYIPNGKWYLNNGEQIFLFSAAGGIRESPTAEFKRKNKAR
jgi:hypothetical protein